MWTSRSSAPARGRLLIDAVHDEADVSLVMLALRALGERADVLDRQRMQMKQLGELAELIGFWVVQVEPEELMGLEVPGDPIEVAGVEYGERRSAGAHAAESRTEPGGSGPRVGAPSRRSVRSAGLSRCWRFRC